MNKDGLVRFQTERGDGEAGTLLRREVFRLVVAVRIVSVVVVVMPSPALRRGLLL